MLNLLTCTHPNFALFFLEYLLRSKFIVSTSGGTFEAMTRVVQRIDRGESSRSDDREKVTPDGKNCKEDSHLVPEELQKAILNDENLRLKQQVRTTSCTSPNALLYEVDFSL